MSFSRETWKIMTIQLDVVGVFPRPGSSAEYSQRQEKHQLW